MKRINISILDDIVKGDNVPVGAAGTHDFCTLRITFSNAWDGTSKTVCFKDAHGTSTLKIVTQSMKVKDGVYDITIPAEPMLYDGEITMSVKGYENETITSLNEDEETVETIQEKYAIITAVAKFQVLPSDFDSNASQNQPITPSVAEQLQSEIDSISGLGDARKWAEGKDNSGADVPSTDAAYHNNAKYYSQQSALSATSCSNDKDATLVYKNQAETAKNTAVATAANAFPAYPKNDVNTLTATCQANHTTWITTSVTSALNLSLSGIASGVENEWRVVFQCSTGASLSVTVPSGYTLVWNESMQPPMTNGKEYECMFIVSLNNKIRACFGEVDA